ncbi:ribose transport system permease protein [Promicromonospora umidemergens]|uniref:Autoinducer 2 import system permease protein LsrD n=1 Tax=Promicromonospora umidemergens TaxID=629679 RepID=A0ABP8XZB9_9MICO|nr:ABC transporter permease [Promicromonospora umidemergens]MCP2284179.1 ribose transport system permease protein [Promicromonospora umidemergens]
MSAPNAGVTARPGSSSETKGNLPTSDEHAARVARIRSLPGGPMLWVLGALVVVSVVLTDGVFIRPSNLTTVLFQSSVIGVLALAQAFAVLCKGLDLSVGATAILAAMVTGGASSVEATFMPHLPLPLAILAGLAVGLSVGVLNGLVVGFTPVPPFIVTLSTYLLVVGVTFLATGAAPVTEPDERIQGFGDANVLFVPAPVLVWVLFIVLASVLLGRTKYGHMVYAVGGNETAARLSGVSVPRVKIIVYATAGLFAAVAGMLFLARTGTVLPSDGESFMLDSIAAVAVGGLSLAGGAGRVRDVVLGVLVLAVVGNLLNILGVSQYLQTAVQGVIILVAVGATLRLGRRSGATP